MRSVGRCGDFRRTLLSNPCRSRRIGRIRSLEEGIRDTVNIIYVATGAEITVHNRVAARRILKRIELEETEH